MDFPVNTVQERTVTVFWKGSLWRGQQNPRDRGQDLRTKIHGPSGKCGSDGKGEFKKFCHFVRTVIEQGQRKMPGNRKPVSVEN